MESESESQAQPTGMERQLPEVDEYAMPATSTIIVSEPFLHPTLEAAIGSHVAPIIQRMERQCEEEKVTPISCETFRFSNADNDMEVSVDESPPETQTGLNVPIIEGTWPQIEEEVGTLTNFELIDFTNEDIDMELSEDDSAARTVLLNVLQLRPAHPSMPTEVGTTQAAACPTVEGKRKSTPTRSRSNSKSSRRTSISPTPSQRRRATKRKSTEVPLDADDSEGRAGNTRGRSLNKRSPPASKERSTKAAPCPTPVRKSSRQREASRKAKEAADCPKPARKAAKKRTTSRSEKKAAACPTPVRTSSRKRTASRKVKEAADCPKPVRKSAQKLAASRRLKKEQKMKNVSKSPTRNDAAPCVTYTVKAKRPAVKRKTETTMPLDLQNCDGRTYTVRSAPQNKRQRTASKPRPKPAQQPKRGRAAQRAKTAPKQGRKC